MTEPIDKKVDDEWKRRAQAEKMQLDAQTHGRAGAAPQGPPDEPEGSLFLSFLSTLAAQAAMFLGLEPDPMTGARRTNPEQARYLIDVLGMLEAKTRGNLTPDEEQQLKLILQELRMAFVELTQAARPRGPRPPGPRAPGR